MMQTLCTHVVIAPLRSAAVADGLFPLAQFPLSTFIPLLPSLASPTAACISASHSHALTVDTIDCSASPTIPPLLLSALRSPFFLSFFCLPRFAAITARKPQGLLLVGGERLFATSRRRRRSLFRPVRRPRPSPRVVIAVAVFASCSFPYNRLASFNVTSACALRRIDIPDPDSGFDFALPQLLAHEMHAHCACKHKLVTAVF